MKEQIKIDVPEGKVPVMEQTENEVVITWKEKELTYTDIVVKLAGSPENVVGFTSHVTNDATSTTPFYRKVDVLRKLTNIRNYFGKPNSYDRGYVVSYNKYYDALKVRNVNTVVDWAHEVLFKEQEHAEQAIKILGDELKYLSKPW